MEQPFWVNGNLDY